ncbi:uncharacterized protein PODANS_1_5090 [Podospora anserina S mat+]|uniref:Podospora anserina S mat+ genomic DNA chromosome 1, supercontig 1 n=1 Tax=Podospora anserina (strain S / ATCC MYA-4624 / DSM 980 / FGSC 10383) TaxID=515849 RepID=B2AAT4_PODAN|nr:uncharacterized protein PODANS_1_5090 [Podospora anserina S mat+]CAP60196.1 unnamed protein product [Podospora anserina S mat+]CDP22837.1 Putative protein of unknown function [Podospora anserina S mat+]
MMYRNTILTLLAGASSVTAAMDPINNAILRARQLQDSIPTSTGSVFRTRTVDACISTLTSLSSSAPSPPPGVLEYDLSQQLERFKTATAPIGPLVDDVADISSVCSSAFDEDRTRTATTYYPPATVIGSEEYDRYRTSALSWYSSIRPVVSEAAQTCSLKWPREVGRLWLPFIDNEEDCSKAFSLVLGITATEPATEIITRTRTVPTETEASTTGTGIPAEETETEEPAEETETSTSASTAGAARETGYMVAVVAAAAGVAGVMGAM